MNISANKNMQAKQQRETIMRERDIQSEWTMCRPMTNSSRKRCPIPLKYEQPERSTCPCRDTSATRALKAQHETFSSTEVFNDKVAIHGECLRSRRSRIHRAAAVIAAAVVQEHVLTYTREVSETAVQYKIITRSLQRSEGRWQTHADESQQGGHHLQCAR